jgi:Uma2 family endonuclease
MTPTTVPATYTPTATAVTYTPPATPVTYGLDASTFRFSVARYQRMVEMGILTSEDRIELLENYVVLKMPRNPPHDGTVQMVTEVLPRMVPQGWRLRVQLTVVLADSQPEPDFSVVRGDARTYLTRHPGPADVGLIGEVAESSLLRDQRDKTRIYARAGIPCYWIVNLVDRRIEVYTQPSGSAAVPAYASFQIYQSGDTVPLVLDGNTVGTVPADELLP